jgi:hypothetical protein
VLILAKNGLGYILSDFLTNAPGNPDYNTGVVVSWSNFSQNEKSIFI